MTDIADLIERTTATYSLLNASLDFNTDASSDAYAWGFSAQWEADGEGTYNGRGVVSSHGPDPVAAILNCSRLVAIKQDGAWPVRVALRVAA